MITGNRSLGDLVATNPAAAKVLHRYRIDFCCGGKRSLEEACASDGLDAGSLAKEIEAAETTANEAETRWNERPLGELIRHILDRYHTPLKAELPRLVELAQKVERVHAGKADIPVGLASLLEEVRLEVESHLAKEEQILFPLIESGRGQLAFMPVQMMIQEHEDHGQNLRRIREITKDLSLPETACATWRELYRSLGQLEVDLMDHIHLENHVLFPRALAG